MSNKLEFAFGQWPVADFPLSTLFPLGGKVESPLAWALAAGAAAVVVNALGN
jgi:hypothetical protein